MTSKEIEKITHALLALDSLNQFLVCLFAPLGPWNFIGEWALVQYWRERWIDALKMMEAKCE